MANVKFARGLQAAYDALQTKNSNTIYICTDTGYIYLGSKQLSDDDYEHLLNKPSINGVTVSGAKTLSQLGIQEALRSGDNIKTVNGTALLGPGNISIPKGDPGADAVNPFKGWLTPSTLPSTGSTGDYCYVTDNGVSTIYKWNGSAFVDSGESVNTSSVQTFATSESVNNVIIDNTGLKDYRTEDNTNKPVIPKASSVIKLKAMLEGVTMNEVKATGYSEWHPTGQNPGYYKADTGAWQDTNNYTSVRIDVSDYDSVRFYGRLFYQSTVLSYTWLDSNSNVLEIVCLDVDTSLASSVFVDYIRDIPNGAKYLLVLNKYGSTFDTSRFYCYLRTGQTVVEMMPQKDTTKLRNPAVNSVALATDSMQMNAKLAGVSASETKVEVVTSGGSQNVFAGRVLASDGSIGSSSYYSYFQIAIPEGTKSIRFKTINGTGWSCGYAFGKMVNDAFVTTRSSEFDAVGYMNVDVEEEETIFRTTCRIETSSYPNMLHLSSFYCYLRTGDTVVDLINEGKFDASLVDFDVSIPKDIKVVTSNFIKESVLKGDYEEEVIDPLNTMRLPYALFLDGKYGENNTYLHSFVMVKPGDIVYVKKGTNYPRIAFVTDSIVKSGGDIALVADTTVRQVTEAYFLVPETANMMLFYCNNSDQNTPSELIVYHKVVAPEDYEIVKFRFEGVNLTTSPIGANNSYKGFAWVVPKGIATIVKIDYSSTASIKGRYISSTSCGFEDGTTSVDNGGDLNSAGTSTNYRPHINLSFGNSSGYRNVLYTNEKTHTCEIEQYVISENEVSDSALFKSLVQNAGFDEININNGIDGIAIQNAHGYYLNGTASKIIPVTEGKLYKFIRNDNYTLRLSWLTTLETSPEAYTRPSFVPGTRQRAISSTDPYFAVAPQGAKYVSLYAGNYLPKYMGEYNPGASSTSDPASVYQYVKADTRGRRIQEVALTGQTPINVSSATDSAGFDSPKTLQELNLIKKTQQFSNIKWTPKSTFYGKLIDSDHKYEQGVEQTSIPYSNNYTDYKFIGQTVSIHTFMTAVNNPYSLLYTEQVSNANSQSIWGRTYKGPNGNSYYGSVCCLFASWVDGYPGYIGNNWWSRLSSRFGVTRQKFIKGEFDPQLLRIGDVLDNGSHSIVITGLKKDQSGNITHVRIAQCSGGVYHGGCRISTHTLDYFKNSVMFQYNDDPYRIYSLNDFFRNTQYEAIPYVQLDGESAQTVTYNNDICTIYGDKASLAEGFRVVLNYDLDGNHSGWTGIEVYKDDVLQNTYNLSSIDQSSLPEGQRNHALDLGTSLTAGMYKARMTDGTNYSDYTYWEIISNNVTIELIRDGVYKVTNNTGKKLLECAIGTYIPGDTLGMVRVSTSCVYPITLEGINANYFTLYLKDYFEDLGISTDMVTYPRVLKLVVQGEYTGVATAVLFLPDVDYPQLTRGGVINIEYDVENSEVE